MDDEGRATGSLDPASHRPRADSRPQRGRGSHFRHRRPPHLGEHGRATYAALDLGTNNCRLLVARPSGRPEVMAERDEPGGHEGEEREDEASVGPQIGL